MCPFWSQSTSRSQSTSTAIDSNCWHRCFAYLYRCTLLLIWLSNSCVYLQLSGKTLTFRKDSKLMQQNSLPGSCSTVWSSPLGYHPLCFICHALMLSMFIWDAVPRNCKWALWACVQPSSLAWTDTPVLHILQCLAFTISPSASPWHLLGIDHGPTCALGALIIAMPRPHRTYSNSNQVSSPCSASSSLSQPSGPCRVQSRVPTKHPMWPPTTLVATPKPLFKTKYKMPTDQFPAQTQNQTWLLDSCKNPISNLLAP